MARVVTRPGGGIDKAVKNIRFGVARALTQVARDASQAVSASLPQVLDRPTPFTLKAASFTPATRDSLKATVFIKDAQAKYLTIQEQGGTRQPLPGSPINLPVKQRVNAYGNIARGAVGRLRAREDTFVATGKGRTSHLAPGIYQRPMRGKQRRGTIGAKGALRKGGTGKAMGGRKGLTALKLLVAFKRGALYQPRLRFRETVERAARANLANRIASSVNEALRTAR